MQKIAAYLLERRDGMNWPEARAAEAEQIKATLTHWLGSKGATQIGVSGTYLPEDGSKGTYAIEQASDEGRTWWMVRLDEVSAQARHFRAAISITNGRDKVAVYVSLEAGSDATAVKPVQVDPKCPRVIRALLDLPGVWYHGSSALRGLREVQGFDQGEGVAEEIKSPERSVPVVAVSRQDGAVVFPDLDTKLAVDLAGLANVVVIDDQASWALTDCLGADFCCFGGAVRVYWPQFSRKEDRYLHPLWTAERLRFKGGNPVETRDRFRRLLRGLVFRAGALGVVRPREIDEIRDGARRKTLGDLKQRTSSLEGFKDLADSYAKDNDELRAENAELSQQVELLESQVARLESDRASLVAHLQASTTSAPTPEGATGESLEPAPQESAGAGPVSGEVRFYKKVHSRHTHDVMVCVKDCGCNNWQGSHAADKARKGIAKLENRSDWKAMQHCASCTGGGMWRVRW